MSSNRRELAPVYVLRFGFALRSSRYWCASDVTTGLSNAFAAAYRLLLRPDRCDPCDESLRSPIGFVSFGAGAAGAAAAGWFRNCDVSWRGFRPNRTLTLALRAPATAAAAGANAAVAVTAAYHGGLVPPFCNAAARGFFSQF